MYLRFINYICLKFSSQKLLAIIKLKMFNLSFVQQSIMESFLHINNKKEHEDYPIFQYPAHYQRKIGCSEAGEKYMYID